MLQIRRSTVNTRYITAMKGTTIWLTVAILLSPPMTTAATQKARISDDITIAIE